MKSKKGLSLLLTQTTLLRLAPLPSQVLKQHNAIPEGTVIHDTKA